MKSPKINTHTEITIPFDLDVIRADKILTSDSGMVMRKSPGERELFIMGYQIVAYMDDKCLECVLCKNGKDGWAEIIGDRADTKMIKGNIEVRILLPKESTVYIVDEFLEKA